MQRLLFGGLLLGLIIWVAWYGYTLTQTLDPEVSPALGAVEKVEDLGYAQCINAAQREYQINSDSGASDPNQALFNQMNVKIEACNTRYKR